MRLQRKVTIHFTPSLTPSLLWTQSFPLIKIFNKLPDFSWYGLQPFIIIITPTLVSRQCTEKHFRSNIISGTSQRHFHSLYAWWKALFLYSRLLVTSFCSDHHALYSFKVFLNNNFNFRGFFTEIRRIFAHALLLLFLLQHLITTASNLLHHFLFIFTAFIRITTNELLLSGTILNFCYRLPSQIYFIFLHLSYLSTKFHTCVSYNKPNI